MPCQLMGANSKLCLMEETGGYGVSPGGNYLNLGFISSDIGGTDDVDNTVVLGLGAEQQRKERDGKTVKGRLIVPLELASCGYWLKGLLGAAVKTGADPNWIFTFKSAKRPLPSFTLEFQQPDAAVPIYTRYPGTVFDSGVFTIGSRGKPRLELTVECQDEIESNTSIAGTPVVVGAVPAYFANRYSFVNLNGSAIGKVTDATMTINNHYDMLMAVGGGGAISCADAGQFELTGQMTTRFNDLVVAAMADAETIVDFNFGWKIGSDINKQLLIEIDAMDILRAGNPISGPGARARVFTFNPFKDTSEGDTLHVTLANQQTNY